jgi:hypothetical protein
MASACSRRLRWTSRAHRCERLASVLAVTAVSCAGAAGSSGVEDKARRDVPIAICRKPLTTADTTETGAPRPEAYWSVLFPKFHGFGASLDPASLNCVGDALLSTQVASSPTPIVLSQSDSTIAAGDDGLQAVWLRTSSLSDRAALGLFALVRPRASELDVYAIGVYRGSSRHSRFEFAKMGATTIVVGRDEGCADVKAGTECESTLSVYLVGGGRLAPAAKTTTERVQFGTMKDVGRIQSRLTTEPPVFDANSMHIKEKLSVRDSGDDEVRRSEGERVFTLRGEEMVANKESIGAQVGHP